MRYHAIKWLKELPLLNRFHAVKDYEAYVHIDTDAILRCEKFNKPSVVVKDIFVVISHLKFVKYFLHLILE